MMRGGQSSRPSRGFLYIEVLVALGLVAAAIVATTPLLMLAAKQNAAAGDRTVAANLAVEKLEALRTVALAELTSGTSSDTVTVGGATFARTWSVEPDVPAIGMTRVTVMTKSTRTAQYGVSYATVSASRAH